MFQFSSVSILMHIFFLFYLNSHWFSSDYGSKGSLSSRYAFKYNFFFDNFHEYLIFEVNKAEEANIIVGNCIFKEKWKIMVHTERKILSFPENTLTKNVDFQCDCIFNPFFYEIVIESFLKFIMKSNESFNIAKLKQNNLKILI